MAESKEKVAVTFGTIIDSIATNAAFTTKVAAWSRLKHDPMQSLEVA